MIHIKRPALLLIMSCMMMASCSASINPMYGKHSDDPADFVDRREMQENNFIADGGYKKKSKSTIIPDDNTVVVGATGSENKRRSDENDQETYTFSHLKNNPPQDEAGFSRQRLNTSNPQNAPASEGNVSGGKASGDDGNGPGNAVSFRDMSDSLVVACADEKMQKEIEDAAISKEEFEKAKEQEVQLDQAPAYTNSYRQSYIVASSLI